MTRTPRSLRPFVDAARSQAIVETGVSADAVLAGIERERGRSLARRSVALSAALAVAAAVVAVVSLSLIGAPEREPAAGASLETVEPPAPADQAPAPAPRLARAVELRSSAAVDILGPWSIALGEGEHELALQPTPGRALRVALPDRELELVEGRVHVQVTKDSAVVRLEAGVAAWIGPDEQRALISVERTDLGDSTRTAAKAPDAPVPAPRPATASELAREAEAFLAVGKNDEAIALLRQLVEAHPGASSTRAGLLDLARLLRKAGRDDEARCAYALYQRRWPNSAVEDEVRSRLEQLGPRPRCRGLDPR